MTRDQKSRRAAVRALAPPAAGRPPGGPAWWDEPDQPEADETPEDPPTRFSCASHYS
jgi:hypothetical protein